MKKFSNEIEAFIKEYVNDLTENNAAIFAGAGLSKSAGYVNWPELLSDIAKELGLSVDKENDLISLAQYHVNEKRGTAGIIRKIVKEFSEKAEPTENHQILARLPISTYWTTNYDKLIETALEKAFKIVDSKYTKAQLNFAKPKRDVVVYKMHGDVDHPENAILIKDQYERYYATHSHFITALNHDLTSKKFLFLGFSFTDPNLDYVLSRLNIEFGDFTNNHYTFIKKVSRERDKKGKLEKNDIYKYRLRKQELMIEDLKRYKINALLIDDHSEITEVLKEIEKRYRKRTIFISGSAEEYGKWDRNDAQAFIHSLSKSLVEKDFRIVNGFGWGVGSAVINGALEAIYENPSKRSEDQLIMKPFPQFKSGAKDLPELWEEYRQRMIARAGVAIFIFGNKNENGKLVIAKGVDREFRIAFQHGLILIPIATTGYKTQEIYEEILKAPTKYYPGNPWILPLIKELAEKKLKSDEIIKKVISLIQIINK